MNLNETREALKSVFTSRLVTVYAKLFNNKEDIDEDIIDILKEYIECGGVIEKGSSFELSQQMLEQRGINFQKQINDQEHYIDEKKLISYSDALKRNSNLTLEQLRTMIDNYFTAREEYGSKDIESRLNNMQEYVTCGGMIPTYIDRSLYEQLRESLESYFEYSEVYQNILTKSKENQTSRSLEQSPLEVLRAEQLKLVEEDGNLSTELLRYEKINDEIGE